MTQYRISKVTGKRLPSKNLIKKSIDKLTKKYEQRIAILKAQLQEHLE